MFESDADSRHKAGGRERERRARSPLTHGGRPAGGKTVMFESDAHRWHKAGVARGRREREAHTVDARPVAMGEKMAPDGGARTAA